MKLDTITFAVRPFEWPVGYIMYSTQLQGYYYIFAVI